MGIILENNDNKYVGFAKKFLSALNHVKYPNDKWNWEKYRKNYYLIVASDKGILINVMGGLFSDEDVKEMFSLSTIIEHVIDTNLIVFESEQQIKDCLLEDYDNDLCFADSGLYDIFFELYQCFWGNGFGITYSNVTNLSGDEGYKDFDDIEKQMLKYIFGDDSGFIPFDKIGDKYHISQFLVG